MSKSGKCNNCGREFEVPDYNYKILCEDCDIFMTPQEQPDSQATLWQDVAEYFLGDYAREHTPNECRKEAYRRSIEADSQVGDEQITYGVDMGAPGGDKTALSIKRGNTVYSFVGDEAEVILAYAERLATERALGARIDELERLGNYKGQYDGRYDLADTVADRIEQLTATLKETKQ